MKNDFTKWLLGLLDNSVGGASLRKVLAVWIMILLTRIHNKYLAVQITKAAEDWSFANFLVISDYLVVLLLIGLIVFQDILKFKNGEKVSEEQKTEIGQKKEEN